MSVHVESSPFSLFGRRAGDEGLREETCFSIVLSGRQWHSKTKILIGVEAAVSPHPNPLPVGEGEWSEDRPTVGLLTPAPIP